MTRQERTARKRYWSRHVQRWQDSGQSKAAYIRSQGVSAHQFYYWCRQLAAPGADAPPARSPASEVSTSRFIPVEIAARPKPRADDRARDGLVVQLGTMQLTLPRDATRAELTEWIAAIQAAC